MPLKKKIIPLDSLNFLKRSSFYYSNSNLFLYKHYCNDVKILKCTSDTFSYFSAASTMLFLRTEREMRKNE